MMGDGWDDCDGGHGCRHSLSARALLPVLVDLLARGMKAEFWSPMILHWSNVCSDLLLKNATTGRVKQFVSCEFGNKGFHCRVRRVGRRHRGR